MIAVGLVVAILVPPNALSAGLYWLHVSMGITAPAPKNARLVALIWVGTMVAIADGLALLLVWLT